MERIVKENYYLDIAETVLERSTCLRRQYGAIIVRNDEIVATGYNGAPRGRKNCSDLGYCVREQMRVPRGERYELCRSVHAEANAIISASRNECIGGDIYPVGRDLVLDVPENDHQRGTAARGHPQFADGIYHRPGPGLDRPGRYAGAVTG